MRQWRSEIRERKIRQRQLQLSRYCSGQMVFLSHQITAYVSVPVRRFVMVANVGGWQLSPWMHDRHESVAVLFLPPRHVRFFSMLHTRTCWRSDEFSFTSILQLSISPSPLRESHTLWAAEGGAVVRLWWAGVKDACCFHRLLLFAGWGEVALGGSNVPTRVADWSIGGIAVPAWLLARPSSASSSTSSSSPGNSTYSHFHVCDCVFEGSGKRSCTSFAASFSWRLFWSLPSAGCWAPPSQLLRERAA